MTVAAFRADAAISPLSLHPRRPRGCIRSRTRPDGGRRAAAGQSHRRDHRLGGGGRRADAPARSRSDTRHLGDARIGRSSWQRCSQATRMPRSGASAPCWPRRPTRSTRASLAAPPRKAIRRPAVRVRRADDRHRARERCRPVGARRRLGSARHAALATSPSTTSMDAPPHAAWCNGENQLPPPRRQSLAPRDHPPAR